MNKVIIDSWKDGIELLKSLKASKSIIDHHETVVETAEKLLDQLPTVVKRLIDRNIVLIGSSLHDCGKITKPLEEVKSGKAHELSGKKLLLSLGVSHKIARFCMIHSLTMETLYLEELLVGIADNLWKGSRDLSKELCFYHKIAVLLNQKDELLFQKMDDVFERISEENFQNYKEYLKVNRVSV
ncbi:HD domain-containing protein [Leptospira sp. FAT2]|uniref:HD domain-containing protein n=1 Tax=Leptospira sanjuanensis TaxID=2879643 RepID=UPI001EE8B18C|nr:HD domain-containing protein [Leptospira sanjuanensis]MCG6192299.1 HD domain-containing protein [Leptospira sanjuanensis]